MTTNDVTVILTRLAVIEAKLETKLSDGSVDTSRIRRLELVVTALAALVLRDGANSLVSLFS